MVPRACRTHSPAQNGAPRGNRADNSTPPLLRDCDPGRRCLEDRLFVTTRDFLQFEHQRLYLQPAAALVEWASDTPWEEVVSKTGFADGDLARLTLRTAEHLRQLAGLEETFPRMAKSAQTAIDLILKEPITTFMK